MDAHHGHPPEAACTPACPGWAEGAVHLFHLTARYREMLEACRLASSIECLVVAPSVPGVLLPAQVHEEALVRLDLVVGRDTPAVHLDDWGVRATLTFRGRRFDCAIPWTAVLAGVLAPPRKERPRFGVIPGGKKD
ncbi:MAG TPA: hypothetical protein VFF02_17580 [Anaeromyxobacteraceae bacterium]|nr:hypothetical protein [Anaeromyxobacteraceae bacterium]